MLVTAVEPPTGDLIAIASRPFVDDLRPFGGEVQCEGLIGGAGREAKGALRLGIAVGGLTGELEEEPDSARFESFEQVERQVALRAACTWGIAGVAVVGCVWGDEVTGVLSEGDDQVMGASFLQLAGEVFDVEVVELSELLIVAG